MRDFIYHIYLYIIFIYIFKIIQEFLLNITRDKEKNLIKATKNKRKKNNNFKNFFS